MSMNPVSAEYIDRLTAGSSRRLYGIATLIMTSAFFIILPNGIDYGRQLLTGKPELLSVTFRISFAVSAVAVLIQLSLLLGKTSAGRKKIRLAGSRYYVSGKFAAAFILALMYSAISLPFLAASSRIEPAPISRMFCLYLYLFICCFSYAVLAEVLSVIWERKAALKRIIIWAVFIFQVFLTPELVPAASPYYVPELLSAGSFSPLAVGLVSAAVLSVFFYVSAAITSALTASGEEAE